MPLHAAATWNRHPVAEADEVAVQYGPEVPTEAELRLLGNVADKRVLELGCGSGRNLVAVALQGAHAIGLDFSTDQLAAARRLADREGVKVELHDGDLADLAFVRADSVDVAFSSFALHFADDINRVFRQVHRVLKEGSAFVFSVVHPAAALLGDDEELAPVLRRSYFDRSRIEYDTDRPPYSGHLHTIADLFAGLGRANFRVELLLEPEPQRPRGLRPPWLPAALILRARKEGL